MLKSISKLTLAAVLIAVASGCDEQFIQPNNGLGKKTNEGTDRPGGFKQNPGESYPYPEIIEQEFIPDYDLYANYKCRTWRITWPVIDSDYNFEMIPSIFSVHSGALHSISYLNHGAPSLTFNSTMTLFNGNKIEAAKDVWELDYGFWPPEAADMDGIRLVKTDLNVSSIQYWVEERPKLFISNWPGSHDNELSYQEGDFIQFYLTQSQLYGGIRIVSMTPRIIEVYLTLPNNDF